MATLMLPYVCSGLWSECVVMLDWMLSAEIMKPWLHAVLGGYFGFTVDKLYRDFVLYQLEMIPNFGHFCCFSWPASSLLP